ncbi:MULTISPECIES: hypothetical protein [unclassified Bradyrhizobium]|nr:MULTISPECIES: hypothetical protein [unclassified Bradyrhizobium]
MSRHLTRADPARAAAGAVSMRVLCAATAFTVAAFRAARDLA